MKTRNNFFKRVASLGLALCMIVGLIWLPSKQNHTHAAQPSGSTIPVGDTIIMYEDFADGITDGWERVTNANNPLVWTQPSKNLELSSTEDGLDALVQYEFGDGTDGYTQSELAWDYSTPANGETFENNNDRYHFRGAYAGLEYKFDAKINGADMGVTMYQSFYGINFGYTPANHTGRIGNILITPEGDIYNALPDYGADRSQYWVGKIDTTKYDLSQWHTYTFRWVKTSQWSGDYYLWIYIDGEYIPYNASVTVVSTNGGKRDYFAVKVHKTVGSVEIDNLSVTQANYSHNGTGSNTPDTIAYNTTNGQPRVIMTQDFEGELNEAKWHYGVDKGSSAEIVDTYENNTGYVTRVNKTGGTYHNTYWFNDQGGKMMPLNANMYISMDVALESNGAIQFRMASLVYNQYYDAKIYRTDFQYALRQAIGNNPNGLYLWKAGDGVAPLVDLSDVDMTQWHTYTLKVLAEAGKASPVVELYVDGILEGSFTKPADGGYSGAYISTNGTNAAGVYYANDEYRRRFQIVDNSKGAELGLTGAASFDNVILSYDAWTVKTMTTNANADGTWSVTWNASEFDEITSHAQTQATSVATVDEVFTRAKATYDVYVNGVKVANGLSATTYTHNVAASCAEDTVVEVKIHGSLKNSAGLTTKVRAHVQGTAQRENEVPADCMNPATYDEVYYCSICGEEMSRTSQTIGGLADCNPGTPVIENMILATCTETGSYDEVVYCSGCNVELSRKQQIIKERPHIPVIDEAKAPTCTETGLTKGYHCKYCDLVYIAQEVIPVVDHTPGQIIIENVVGSTCGAVGTYDEAVYCTECGKELSREQKTTEKLPHTPVTDAAVVAGCETTGLTEGSHCSVCNEVLVKQEIVPAAGHTAGEAVAENTVGATCGAVGTYDEVTYCTECGKELSREQKTTEKLPHTPVTDEAVKPTCTETGLTEGSHCGVCGEVFVAQEIVPVVEHTAGEAVAENAVGATCGAVGTYDEVTYCTECGKELSREQKTTEKLPHTPVTDAAVAAGCETTGLTEGSHCSVCNEVLVKQEVVPAAGHTAVTDAAVAAGCETTGLTEGSHCSVCSEVLVKQEEVPALGHSYDNEYDTTCNNEGCTTGDREGPAQTGDASIVALAAMMLPVSGIGLGALCIKRKKED